MARFFLRYLNLLYRDFEGDLVLPIVLGEIAHHNIIRLYSLKGGGMQVNEQADNYPVHLVYVHLVKSTGDPEGDQALKRQVADAFGIRQEAPFRKFIAGFRLKRVQELTSIQSAELQLYETVPGGQVVVTLWVSPLGKAAIVPQKAKGILATGEIRDFPTIFENDRSKFVFILNGGTGLFSDTDPWFGGYGEEFNGSNPPPKIPWDRVPPHGPKDISNPGSAASCSFPIIRCIPMGLCPISCPVAMGMIFTTPARGATETSKAVCGTDLGFAE